MVSFTSFHLFIKLLYEFGVYILWRDEVWLSASTFVALSHMKHIFKRKTVNVPFEISDFLSLVSITAYSLHTDVTVMYSSIESRMEHMKKWFPRDEETFYRRKWALSYNKRLIWMYCSSRALPFILTNDTLSFGFVFVTLCRTQNVFPTGQSCL